jgi:hypothetical protein
MKRTGSPAICRSLMVPVRPGVKYSTKFFNNEVVFDNFAVQRNARPFAGTGVGEIAGSRATGFSMIGGRRFQYRVKSIINTCHPYRRPPACPEPSSWPVFR